MQDVQTLTLNEGQALASEGFFEFLLGPEKELNISGAGGVGKTFLLGHLIDEILPKYFDTCKMMGVEPEYSSVHMTATTNKAAEVLGQQTGRPTSTVHSFFGLKVVDDYKTGESKVSKSTSWTVYSNIILIIDESSMIDRQLYEFIMEGTCKSKVVYVGDKNQMAPVKETLSPVYKRVGIPMFELLEPMRTMIPELHALNTQCRDTVESGENSMGIFDFKPIKIVPGIIDWLSDEQFQDEIDTRFADPSHDNVILAYRNTRVVQFNDYVRQLRGLPTHFTAGESLVSNSAPRFGKFSLSVEDEIRILSMQDEVQEFVISEEANISTPVRYALVENSFGEQCNIPIPMDTGHVAELIKYFKKIKKWHAYYYMRNNLPDLRQRDARTVYKIQGSSVAGTVYIDASDLSTCHNPSQAARQIYVAVSRARMRVAFHGVLADKYGGLIL